MNSTNETIPNMIGEHQTTRLELFSRHLCHWQWHIGTVCSSPPKGRYVRRGMAALTAVAAIVGTAVRPDP